MAHDNSGTWASLLLSTMIRTEKSLFRCTEIERFHETRPHRQRRSGIPAAQRQRDAGRCRHNPMKRPEAAAPSNVRRKATLRFRIDMQEHYTLNQADLQAELVSTPSCCPGTARNRCAQWYPVSHTWIFTGDIESVAYYSFTGTRRPVPSSVVRSISAMHLTLT